MGNITIHGGARLLGEGAEISNLQFEELAKDPTSPSLGSVWLNADERVIKCVTALSVGLPVIKVIPLVDVKSSGYGNADTVPTNVRKVITGSIIGAVSGNSIIVNGNAEPLANEGTELWSVVVTPADIASNFLINFDAVVGSGTNGRFVTFTLWRQIGTSALTYLGMRTSWIDASNDCNTLSITIGDSPNTLLPVTYSLRAGISSNATWHVGRRAGASFGNAGKSSYSIMEFKPI